MNKLKEKVVLITGAGKGSGRILAQAFAEHKWKMISVALTFSSIMLP